MVVADGLVPIWSIETQVTDGLMNRWILEGKINAGEKYPEPLY